ncbi:AraC family transcriptional regulator [Nocardia abscessus]|uniref:AraC family transcriptional regulator n=1 Tax=Nocardia abscessus TaxID=120957 RepID=UPI0006852095|nr:AraC family transcriptional regulator [Nocardia abscessus]MCC3332229.1 AraC family transcriptional regulator [Nocardia abscessus]
MGRPLTHEPTIVARFGADLLAAVLRQRRTTAELLDFEVETSAHIFVLRITDRCSEPSVLQFLVEQACCAATTLARSMFDVEILPAWIEFAYPPPTHAAAYRRSFGCEIRFGAPTTRICFAAGTFDLSTAGVDPTHDHPGIVAAVERVLRDNIRQPLTKPLVAKHLMMSERTLHRRLAEAGQKFGEIRDRVRLQRANTLLRESNLPISAVATEVGFGDSREFRRAYQRWTGRTATVTRAVVPMTSPFAPHAAENTLRLSTSHLFRSAQQ